MLYSLYRQFLMGSFGVGVTLSVSESPMKVAIRSSTLEKVIGSWTGGKGNWKAKVLKGKAVEGDKVTLVTRYGAETLVQLGTLAGEVIDFSGNVFECFTFQKVGAGK